MPTHKKKSRNKPSKRPKTTRKGGGNLRAYFTTRGKNKRRIYASWYGYEGWPIGG